MKNQNRRFKVVLSANKWDSKYFGTKIGNLKYDGAKAPKNLILDMICKKVEYAKKKGYRYLVFSFLNNQSFLRKILLKKGFKLSASYVDLVCPVQKKDFSGDKTDYTVKPAKKDDLTSAVGIAARSFRLSRIYRLKFASRKNVDNYHRTWVRNLYKGKKSKVFVAISRGKIWGFLAVKEDAQAQTARIILIAADSKVKGRGVGSSLMRFVFDWAKEKKLKKMYVKTQSENYKAISFYKKHGFKIYSRDYKYHMYYDGA